MLWGNAGSAKVERCRRDAGATAELRNAGETPALD